MAKTAKSENKKTKNKPSSSAKKVTVKKKSAVASKPVKKAIKKTTKKTSEKLPLKSSMPIVGQLAPEFTLTSDTHGPISLSKFRGKNVVLYFYPKDNTPGCTRQACSFQECETSLEKLNAVVIGVSPDSIQSHEKFRKKFALNFILISDEDHKLAETYGCWVEKNNYGRKYMGIQRSTFLIDRHGFIRYVWPKVSVDGHTSEVIDEINHLD